MKTQIDTAQVTAHLKANWKTSAVGLAVLILGVSASVHFDSSGHLAMTQKDWFTAFIALLAGAVGISQKDAGKMSALTPSGEVAAVDSHEEPDDPANVPPGKQ